MLRRVAASRWTRHSKEGPANLDSEDMKNSGEANEASDGDDLDAGSQQDFTHSVLKKFPEEVNISNRQGASSHPRAEEPPLKFKD